MPTVASVEWREGIPAYLGGRVRSPFSRSPSAPGIGGRYAGNRRSRSSGRGAERSRLGEAGGSVAPRRFPPGSPHRPQRPPRGASMKTPWRRAPLLLYSCARAMRFGAVLFELEPADRRIDNPPRLGHLAATEQTARGTRSPGSEHGRILDDWGLFRRSKAAASSSGFRLDT